MKKNYTLTEKDEYTILIEVDNGKSPYYPYEPIKTYIEVSADMDSETVSLKSWHGEIEYHYRLMRNPKDPLANWQGRQSAENYVGSEPIEEAIKIINKAPAKIKKAIRAGKQHPAYKEMESEVKANVKHFAADFTFHDAKYLGLNPDTPFLWIVRPCGTWTIEIREKKTVEPTIVKHCLKNEPEAKYFIYNPLTTHLTQLTISELERKLNQ